jgi:hypothetical protein
MRQSSTWIAKGRAWGLGLALAVGLALPAEAAELKLGANIGNVPW